MLTPDEFELLQLGTEDYYGIFTADWSFRSRDQTGSAASPKQRAQEAIKSLVTQGLIALYQRNAWIEGTVTPVSSNQIEVLLADPATWAAPPTDNASYACFATTDKGIDALSKHNR
jgi:hypothetical protein